MMSMRNFACSSICLSARLLIQLNVRYSSVFYTITIYNSFLLPLSMIVKEQRMLHLFYATRTDVIDNEFILCDYLGFFTFFNTTLVKNVDKSLV